jgi:hypothetical protein
MDSQTITRLFSALCLLTAMTAAPAMADSASTQNANSDMMLSAPTFAEPMKLTIKHPKNTPVRVTIVTDAASGAEVDYSASKSADPTIGYKFPAGSARDITVVDGQGQELWSLLSGQVSVAPADAAGPRPSAILALLDRDYMLTTPAMSGVYTLHPRSNPEFLSTTDIARVNSAGMTRRWAHRSSPLVDPIQDSATEETTIIISPSTHVVAPVRHPSLQ